MVNRLKVPLLRVQACRGLLPSEAGIALLSAFVEQRGPGTVQARRSAVHKRGNGRHQPSFN